MVDNQRLKRGSTCFELHSELFLEGSKDRGGVSTAVQTGPWSLGLGSSSVLGPSSLVHANRDEESVVFFNREGKEFQLMRLIRKLLVLTIVGVAGVAAYAYWSDNGSILRGKATEVATGAAKREAAKLAGKAAETGKDAAGHLGDTVTEATLTAKIKSKMALDDHVNARSIDVHTSDGVATLSGIVASADERKRAVQLARDTEGITRVVDRLEIKRP
jgi:hypothetical protein